MEERVGCGVVVDGDVMVVVGICEGILVLELGILDVIFVGLFKWKSLVLVFIC